MNIIEFSNVTKIYRKGFWAKKVPAVTDCSFSVEQGVVTGFVGPNGAGKTTSIKMILGMVRPSAGRIMVAGKNPHCPDSRKDIAYISEQPYFYHHLTVRETLLFAARLHARPRLGIETDIEKALVRVGLDGLGQRKIKDLSKGMQQRCAMAQALLMHSNILVLDEPLSGLDPLGRRFFRDILRACAEKGTTIFFSTHIIDDIESLCRRVVVLSKGRTEYQGSIDDLVAKGTLGTDIVIPEVTETLREVLMRTGCEISVLADNKTNVFVPANRDIVQCQRLLCEHRVFCESMTKRCTPLEEILYRRNREQTDL
jgi:ABC-2 type transport system ATP-binding protein